MPETKEVTMKHTRKRILSILAAAALSLCSLPQSTPLLLRPAITASAAETSGTCGENVNWVYDEETKTLTISGTGDMTDYYHESVPWVSWNKEIKTAVIEKGVTSIGESAFYDCIALTSVTIPDGVTTIGDHAFYFCKTLPSVVVPDSVTSVLQDAFYMCLELSDITLPDTLTHVGREAFDATPWMKSCWAKSPFVTAGGMLIDAKTCTGAVTIPDGITHIADYAFEPRGTNSKTESMTSVVIPDSVTEIGQGAFKNCDQLTKVTLPDSLTSLSGEMFGYCDRLNNVVIPDSVTEIKNGAFYYCEALDTITIPESVTSIGWSSLLETKWMSDRQTENPLVIVNNILIDGRTCKGDVTIPDGVKSINYSALYNAELTSVTIPESVTLIDEYAFQRCEKLTSVTVPASVTSIGDYAFSWCSQELIIKGCTGSCAETYAKENKILFETIAPPETTTIAATTTTKATTTTAKATTTVTTSAATKPVTTTVTYPEAQIYAQIIRSNPGETVRIPVFLLKNPGITAVSISFSYDSTKLELLSVENGLIFSAADFTPGDDLHAVPYTVTWKSASRSNLTANGILAYLNVRVPEDAEGNIPIDLTLNQKATINADSEEVAFDVLYGMVMVQSAATTAKAATTTAKATTTTAKATTTTAKATTTTAKATTTTAKATTTTAKATTTTPKATTTTPKATTTTAKATTTTAKATTTTAIATTTAKATTTTAKATTTTAKATTTAAPFTTTIPTETMPAVTTTAAPAPLRGDVNGDDTVSVDDAQLTLKAYTNRIAGNDMKLTAEQIKAADVDGNGEISVEDAQWLLKYYTEKNVAGKAVTWDEILGKKTQSLPRLIRKSSFS